ncbi:hypothetical protein MKK75_06705 [Methylobacterium sp. J-030]|uniref:hypothetical protein n=1 Tax=Methylobacterium sp. J-030 TaxID=2836627 RepID=UPI001FBA39A1|nr:hypothetical protein [Methylobacterium sp. J-030]MCJ2068496.1 hypothetical protein [Methylobacterium sp. J-030]
MTLELEVALMAGLQTLTADGEVDRPLMPGSASTSTAPRAPAGGCASPGWPAAPSAFRTIKPPDFRAIRILSLGKTSVHHHHTVERRLSKGVTRRASSISATAWMPSPP